MTNYIVVSNGPMRLHSWRNNDTGELLDSVPGLPAASSYVEGTMMTIEARRAPIEGSQGYTPLKNWKDPIP